MHSLPSRRRLPQPNFFRFKCYRLSPVPLPRLSPSPAPPPPSPAPTAAAASAIVIVIPGLLPATACLPFITPPPVPTSAHALAHTPPAGAAHRQARFRPPAQTQPQHTPGTEQQADTHLCDAAVRRQGRRTVSQSSNGDSVITPDQSHTLIFMTSAHLHHTHLCSCVRWCQSLWQIRTKKRHVMVQCGHLGGSNSSIWSLMSNHIETEKRIFIPYRVDVQVVLQ